MIRHIVLVNGLGKWQPFYWLVTQLWKLRGFQAHLFWFSWEDSEETYDEKMRRLQELCQALAPKGVAVIGVSAGGTAAVNVLARVPTIQRVITVSSPYYLVGPVQSKLLALASEELKQTMKQLSVDTKQKIISLHATRDLIVGIQQSMPPGIAHIQLKSVGHVQTIFYVLVLNGARLQQFLRP